jgi:hypothetical protein
MALILTKAGLTALASAETTGIKEKATHIAVGDGNGVVPEFAEDSAGLVNERWRGDLQTIELKSDGKTVEFAGHVPITVGGWYIREVAIYADDTLLAIGGHPSMWKPGPEDSANKLEATIYAPVKIDNAGTTLDLTVDSTKVMASQEHVAEKIATHDDEGTAHGGALAAAGQHAANKENPHNVTCDQIGASPSDHTHASATTAEKGLARFGTEQEHLNAAPGVAATPQGVHAITALIQGVPAWVLQSTMRNTMERLVREGLSILGLTDMFVDEFTDDTGVDLGQSTAEYMSGFFSSPLLEGGNVETTGQAICSGYDSSSHHPNNAFDNNNNTGWANNQAIGAAGVSWIGQGFAESKRIMKMILRQGEYSQTGNSDYLTSAVKVRISHDGGSSYEDLQTFNISKTDNIDQTLDLPAYPAGSHLYVTNAVACGAHWSVRELQMIEGLPQDLVLVSKAQAAASVPDSAMFLMRCKHDGVLNTDLMAYVSRDDGVTWSQGDLVKISEEGDVDYYEATVNLASQPSGTAMRWKLVTANQKQVDVEACALAW